MNLFGNKWIIAFLILIIDLITIGIPLGTIFLVIIILNKPSQVEFIKWLQKL